MAYSESIYQKLRKSIQLNEITSCMNVRPNGLGLVLRRGKGSILPFFTGAYEGGMWARCSVEQADLGLHAVALPGPGAHMPIMFVMAAEMLLISGHPLALAGIPCKMPNIQFLGHI